MRSWCEQHIPRDWRAAQTGVSDEEFARFQKAWFTELHSAGYAVPHWPREWGGGMSVAEQIVLYQELAPTMRRGWCSRSSASTTPRRPCSPQAPTSSVDAISRRSSTVKSGSRGSPNRRPAPTWRACARRHAATRDAYVVNGQKLWASGGKHADWCLLLARTDPEAPKRKGISYFLLDMTTPGVEVRPIRNAIGDSHFCEIFLNDVEDPRRQPRRRRELRMAGGTGDAGAERGMTMLELAERLGNAGFRWLVQSSADRRPDSGRPAGAVRNRDHRSARAVPKAGGECRGRHRGSADASIVKLYYSELLQRMTDFGAEIGGLAGAYRTRRSGMSSGWESGSWMLDFIGSWEWTIPGGSSEIQRTIIAERGLGLPREPSAV